MFAEQHLDEGQGGLVQLLQLLLIVAHIELGDVEKGLLLVLAQERRDSCQHHIGQNTNTPEHTIWNTGQKGLGEADIEAHVKSKWHHLQYNMYP